MAGRTYVAGQKLSLADLVLAADLKPAFEQVQEQTVSCSS
jgi:glutathione S-transferase